MSIEKAIIDSINEALNNKFLTPIPIYADKRDMAKFLGVSIRTLGGLSKKSIIHDSLMAVTRCL